MKLTVTRPNIHSINVTLSPGDRYFDACLNANFEFNSDTWQLNVSGDAGHFSHRWTPEKERTFLEMLASASSEYLMRKLGTQVFSLSRSVEQTLTNLADCCSESQEPDIYHYIRILDDGHKSEEVFYTCARAVLKDPSLYKHHENRLSINSSTDYFVCLAKEFPSPVIAIINLFDAYIRPNLRCPAAPDCILVQHAEDDGLTASRLAELTSRFGSDTILIPLEIQGDSVTIATGFLAQAAAETIDYRYEPKTEFHNKICEIIDDLANENMLGVYDICGLKVDITY